MSINAITLPSITNLKLGIDQETKYLYIKSGGREL